MSTSILPASSDGHKLPRMVGAVIYIRVSTKEQTENLSLSTQLKACDEYCQRQGFEVLARFREEGESAKSADRTELQKMLHYCRLHKGRVQFVVVFNLTRFAREKYDHFVLRAHLKSLGISLRSATEPIDDTSTGKLMEGVLAAFAQFDNDVRSERTRGGMRAALELGRWTFLAPLGYLNAPRAMGNSLIPDPERASLVRRAFQDFATGRFTKHEVRKAVNDLGLKTRRGQPVPSQHSTRCCAIASTSRKSKCRTRRLDAWRLRTSRQREGLFSRPGNPRRPARNHRAASTERSRFSAQGLCALRDVRQAVDRELVERTQRLLRVLPLPRTMPRGEHQQGEA
jgi:DNA invertase Pin-like site-specific DNA recombinase